MQSFFKKSIILNKKWLIYVVLITLVGSACGAFISKEKEISKSNDKEKIVFNIVKEIATSYHFNKMSINDDYAKKVLFSLLKTVDKGKRFFIQEDINSLQSRELQLDDEFIQSSLETFEIYLKILIIQVLVLKKFLNFGNQLLLCALHFVHLKNQIKHLHKVQLFSFVKDY